MMLEVQLEQENDFENPSSNAESEDENDLPEDWIPPNNGKKVSVLDLWLSFRKKGWELRYLNEQVSDLWQIFKL